MQKLNLMMASLALGGIVLLGCGGGGGGGGDDTGPTGPTPPPSQPGVPGTPTTASVAMLSQSDGYGYETHAFNPENVTIARNGSVTWSNGTGFVHNVTFSGAGAPSNVPDHTTGSSARTFANAGTFSYSCTNHLGMTGVVVVQ
jgi:plastocyanin